MIPMHRISLILPIFPVPSSMLGGSWTNKHTKEASDNTHEVTQQLTRTFISQGWIWSGASQIDCSPGLLFFLFVGGPILGVGVVLPVVFASLLDMSVLKPGRNHLLCGCSVFAFFE